LKSEIKEIRYSNEADKSPKSLNDAFFCASNFETVV